MIRTRFRLRASTAILAERLQAHGASPRIVLADGDDPRVRGAACTLSELGVGPLLICAHGRDGRFPASVERLTVPDLMGGAVGEAIRQQGDLRHWSERELEKRLRDVSYLAAALVQVGGADGAVAGSRQPSGDVIRAGLHQIGMGAAGRTLSGSFLMVPPSSSPLAFGDCAVVPEPDADQLADIAIATSDTFQTLTGLQPKIAMLSFSTLGSAQHETVATVRAATARVRERRASLDVDGELQLDAAIDRSVAQRKAPQSSVAGNANVLIFPSLAAGNIGYKLTERLGKAEALGPILQGLRSPLNDLSRGCSTDDVINVAVITALQATGDIGKEGSRASATAASRDLSVVDRS